MRTPISLDERKNNSNGTRYREICPSARKYIEFTDGKIIKTKPLECNRYDCPVCGPRRIKSDREKYYKMARGYLNSQQSKYPELWKREGKYWVKMLTLTCPGKDYRMSGYQDPSYSSEYNGLKRPGEAYKEMQGNFNRLNTLLRKHFPKMTTIRIYEPQRDGYPHFHVLLLGPDANKRGLLEFIRQYWVGVYSMGNVDIQSMKKGLGGGLNYAIKYLTKLTRGLVHLPKGARVINAAHRLYKWAQKRIPKFTLVRMGNFNSDDGYGTPFWEIPDEKPLMQMEADQRRANFIELCDFFDSVSRPKQMKFNFIW